MGEQPGGLNGDAKWMAEGVHRIVGAKTVHAEMVQRTDMHRQGAAEFLRLLVDRPIHLGAEMILDALAVGRQHAAEHAKLIHRAAQFEDGGVDILDWQQRHPLEPGIFAGELFVEPVVVGAASGDRPVRGNKPAYGEAKRRIEHAGRNPGLVEKTAPTPAVRDFPARRDCQMAADSESADDRAPERSATNDCPPAYIWRSPLDRRYR